MSATEGSLDANLDSFSFSTGSEVASKGDAQDAYFPVVCIGASAGGLEALEQFFRACPTQLGMAFVLVSHLDPGHHSLLAEIIRRSTGMPVVDGNGEVVAYRSVRRQPKREAVINVTPLYAEMLAAEQAADTAEAIQAELEVSRRHLGKRGLSYEQMVSTLGASNDLLQCRNLR